MPFVNDGQSLEEWKGTSQYNLKIPSKSSVTKNCFMNEKFLKAASSLRSTLIITKTEWVNRWETPKWRRAQTAAKIRWMIKNVHGRTPWNKVSPYPNLRCARVVILIAFYSKNMQHVNGNYRKQGYELFHCRLGLLLVSSHPIALVRLEDHQHWFLKPLLVLRMPSSLYLLHKMNPENQMQHHYLFVARWKTRNIWISCNKKSITSLAGTKSKVNDQRSPLLKKTYYLLSPCDQWMGKAMW